MSIGIAISSNQTRNEFELVIIYDFEQTENKCVKCNRKIRIIYFSLQGKRNSLVGCFSSPTILIYFTHAIALSLLINFSSKIKFLHNSYFYSSIFHANFGNFSSLKHMKNQLFCIWLCASEVDSQSLGNNYDI